MLHTFFRNEKAWNGYWRVAVAAACWSTGGFWIRLIIEHYGLTAQTLTFWRNLIGFGILVLLVSFSGRGSLRVARRDLVTLIGMGAMSPGLSFLFWTQAVVLIPIAIATVLSYTSPVFVVLFTWMLWHAKPGRYQVFALTVALFGIVLISGAYNLAGTGLNWWGVFLGLCDGVTSACYTVIGKRVLPRYPSWTVLTYCFGSAALLIFLMNPAAALPIFNIAPEAWLAILGLTCISTLGGFGLYTSGLKYLAASSASITATLEPVIASMLAFVLLGEILNPVQITGGVFVIGAVLLLARTAHKEPGATLTEAEIA